MPSQSWRLEGANREWKAAWCSVQGLLYALFLLLCTLFLLADQDSSCCNYVLRTADLYAPILFVTTSWGNIREAAISVWSATTLRLFCYYFTLYHYYCNYFFNYLHYSKIKSRISGWNSLHTTSQQHHPSRGMLFVACRSGVDSIWDHQHVFSHNRARIFRAVRRVGTTDVCKPSGTHGWMKLIAQVINGLGNQRPLVLPHVVRKSKILTNLQ